MKRRVTYCGGLSADREARTPRRGLTLIELILVLALLSIVVSLSAPSLAPFFRGRGLKEEARRMLALTRYARSEAVSRCVPMELWIDPDNGDYGLRPKAGFEFEDTKKPIQYDLKENLAFVVDTGLLDKNRQATILFQPDGTIDETSLPSVFIESLDNQSILEVAQLEYGLGYEIRIVDSNVRRVDR